MKRRTVLASVPAALLMGGCTDILSGDEVTFEADTAVVAEATLSETDYDEKRVEEQTIERNFDQVDKTVVVVNSIAEYARSVSIGPLSGELARFTALATPSVEVGPVGPLNPVDDMSNKKLAQMVQEQYDSVKNVQPVGERDGTLLGETSTISKFSAEAQTQSGESVDIFLHITQTASGGDFVVAIGAHPQDIDEDSRIDQLIQGIEHPVATETS
ncbi:DUF6517 family protein [Natronomonas sp.]|uniref:DUF6517 family protein n=1 Tax=Natronomonas sp. TaxID=2184060 RepID=UPI003988E1C3